jgi:hypothetical protein
MMAPSINVQQTEQPNDDTADNGDDYGRNDGTAKTLYREP